MEGKVKAIIIDDELNGRETLFYSLKEVCPNVEVIAQAGSVDEGISVVESNSFDILFLDIEMPNGTGFDLLQKVNQSNFDVIFTTAYDQYAVKAFKYSAIDYLLKPINLTELKEAVDKIEVSDEPKDKRKLDLLKENLTENNKSFSRLALPASDGLEFIEINDIIRCEADGNYTNFFLAGGKRMIVGKTLKEYEELLSDQGFFRVHKSHLINLSYMSKYVKGTGGYVIMNDGKEVEVAKRRKEAFMARLSND